MPRFRRPAPLKGAPRTPSAPAVQSGDVVVIEKIVAGGEGLARLESGLACFVPGALPGDRVTIHEYQDHRTYGRATRTTLEAPSPDRVPSPCRHSAECGGCDWLEWSYEHQLTGKLEILHTALSRIGRLSIAPETLSIVPSPSRLGYRSRARLHVDGEGALCFRQRKGVGKVPIAECPVLSTELQDAVRRCGKLVADNPTRFRGTEELEIRALGPQPTVAVIRPTGRPPKATYRDTFGLVVNDGEPPQLETLPLLESTIDVPVGGFSQVNWPINERLVTHLVDGAASRKVETFADMYCGAGNFALPLLRAGLIGYGVDVAGPGIAALRAQAQTLGHAPEHFVAGEVRGIAQRWVSQQRGFHLVIADPPRSGLGAAAHALAALAQRHLFLCACDPVTFARDLKAILDQGFELESVRAWDMFPHTHHFESTAWLRRIA